MGCGSPWAVFPPGTPSWADPTQLCVSNPFREARISTGQHTWPALECWHWFPAGQYTVVAGFIIDFTKSLDKDKKWKSLLMPEIYIGHFFTMLLL